MQQPFMPPWRGPCYCLQCPLPQLARLLLDLLWNQLRNHLLFEVTPWSASFSWSSLLSLDSILKSRDLTLPTKVCLVKAMVFSVVMYGCKSWTIKKAEHWRIDAFELWCCKRPLKVPWTARRSNQFILKEISPEYSSEGLMLKLQYFGHLMWRTNSLEKAMMLGKIESRRRRGRQRMRWLDGITESMDMSLMLGFGDGQGGLACYSPWGQKESDTTERLNWTELNWSFWVGQRKGS